MTIATLANAQRPQTFPDCQSGTSIPFNDGDKWGYLTVSGITIPPQFKSAGPFSGGLAIVCTVEGCEVTNTRGHFYDAHDVRPLTDRASEETVRKALRERLANAKQTIVLVGENTKNLYRFVRWEIEISQKRDLPIIVVNLNGSRKLDANRCPAILRDWLAAHVEFKAKIIQHALDNFPDEYTRLRVSTSGPRYYADEVYRKLGL